MQLKGKNVVVTGASSGIGLELVKQLLEKGCRVVAAARTIHKVTLSNERLHLFSCDVSIPEGVESLFLHALNTMGSIDIFVANAGFAYYEKLDAPDWSHISAIYNTNVNSMIYSAQKMKQLHGNQPFNFVATASGMSFLSLPGYALYSSTKAAVRGFADAYRWELEKGQYFQVVYPIATRTEFFRNAGSSPIPWPSQHVKPVAESMLRGIERNKSNIFPSKIHYATYLAGKVLPMINTAYTRVQYNKFKQWIENKKN